MTPGVVSGVHFSAARETPGMREGRGIATRAELERLIADRKNDPPTIEHDHPAPSWVVTKTDPNLSRKRIRERRIRYLTNRLDGATQRMETGYDRTD